jgi:flotillin
MAYWLVPVIALALVVVVFSLYMASRYKRCPSDAILVVYGKVGEGMSARCIHGGGALIWPLIQDFQFMSLTPMTISIPLQNALSKQNIRINIPSTFTVGISKDATIMTNAAERLLGLKDKEIEGMAMEIIFGQLRLTVAGLDIESINQNRDEFLAAVTKNVEPELNKIGLYLINVNITDITDESDYIESIGKRAAAEAINQAKKDVAEQTRMGEIGKADADREREIEVAKHQASSDKGQKSAERDRRVYVKQQEAQAIDGETKASADIADYQATLAKREAEALQKGEVAKREAEIEIQKAQYRAEQERLRAKDIVQRETDKKMIEIAAEAEAEKTRREAKGVADAILLKYEAEAAGIRQVLESKAAGYKGLVESTNGDSKAAASLLLIEKLEEITKTQIEAIKNLKIDKITVWDSGDTTANFASGLIKSLPQLHDVAKMAGLELPDYLGSTSEKLNGGNGQPEPKDPKPAAPTPHA